jgi:cyclopropane-fatty-acyl-phospholipid synthase
MTNAILTNTERYGEAVKTNKAKARIIEILSFAGITVNGSQPWDIQVHDEAFYHIVLLNGSMGLGESYMKKMWDCNKLDEFFARVLRASLEDKIKMSPKLILDVFLTRIFNYQTQTRAFKAVQRHYDLDNALFQNMLDKRMTYSCAYWKNATTLDEAQEKKFDLICQKLNFKKGMHILDIGCGWGSFAKYAAEKYGVKVTGITASKKQIELGQQLCNGLPVEFHLMDYRDLEGQFDHIVSVGMFEHVGMKNYHTYMEVVDRCLKDDGLFLLHSIGCNISASSAEPWMDKYIFPDSMLPSIKQIGEAIEGLFVMEDWHNLSTNYDKTLMAWYDNFDTHWSLIEKNYDENFYRMWKFYLLMCAGSFRARHIQLWQIVLSKKGMVGGYASIR